jgi:hypothetical protein
MTSTHDKNNAKSQSSTDVVKTPSSHPSKQQHAEDEAWKKSLINSKFEFVGSLSHLASHERTIERMKLNRMRFSRIKEWGHFVINSQLTPAEILNVIYELFVKNDSYQFPEREALVSSVYGSLDSGVLIPDLLGVLEWMRRQGFTMRNPPDGIPERNPSKPTELRNQELQQAANNLAEKMKAERRGKCSKRNVAESLASSDAWKECTAVTIERLIKKQW